MRRDILSKEQFEHLLSRVGATPDTTLVLYGDFRNWFAAFAFWTFRIYDHRDIRLLNGGRRKWIDEGREVTEAVPSFTATAYQAADADMSIR
ncbi:MAG: sulfurtransferase, partial [Acidimicrobiales bacterium]